MFELGVLPLDPYDFSLEGIDFGSQQRVRFGRDRLLHDCFKKWVRIRGFCEDLVNVKKS